MEKNKPLVSIVILNYNGHEVLKACLDSVFKSTYSAFEVIVVDNNSIDGSDEIARRMYDIHLLKNKSNVGFCAGNNTGIRAARGEFIVLLNNDTVVHPEWLNQLVHEATCFDADLCQPKILLFGNGRTINSTGLTIHFAGFGMLRGSGEIDVGQYDKVKEVCGVHGACFFASKKAVEKMGLLDENFFAFNEDTDWSWRALLMGLKIIYVPTALVYHKWGHGWGSRGAEKFYYAERNRIIMVMTNYSKHSLILLLPTLLLTEFATLGYCVATKTLFSKIRAYADVIRMSRYIMNRRKFIQNKRKMPDKWLANKFTFRFEHAFLAKNVEPLNTLYGCIQKIALSYF